MQDLTERKNRNACKYIYLNTGLNMADAKVGYPQIPSTVWWGLRDQFKKSIPTKVSDTYLVTSLSVQSTAAKQYLKELKNIGLLDEDGRPTQVAKDWRMDDTYKAAVDKLFHAAYPEELINLAPASEKDRDKVVRWFMSSAGLGEGAAKNKAGTYFMIGGDLPPSDAMPKAAKAKSTATKKETVKAPAISTPSDAGKNLGGGEDKKDSMNSFPLNINLQIHISADATSEQIEAIFMNMKKYLRD